MTSRPNGPKPYDGPVIIPGADGSVPVDPLDPTKGRVTPVASAQELTAGVTELFQAANALNSHLNLVGDALQQGFADIAKLIEELIQDLVNEHDGDSSWLSEGVQEFLTAMATSREQAEQAADAEAAVLQARAEENDVDRARVNFENRPEPV